MGATLFVQPLDLVKNRMQLSGKLYICVLCVWPIMCMDNFISWLHQQARPLWVVCLYGVLKITTAKVNLLYLLTSVVFFAKSEKRISEKFTLLLIFLFRTKICTLPVEVTSKFFYDRLKPDYLVVKSMCLS